ncbi:MAG: SurA N-terminal domain-containing protein [Gammaproteobacteria bacterium]|nr:SurA N-terminal domain-containing protein [Gammaproteobacteria bacterium]
MLQNIRDRAQGWIAWAIVILISIPFALWGIQEYLGVGSEPVVATVNDNEITERELDRRYQQFRQDLREQLGAAYRPELFDDNRMRQEVLKRMVREDLILQASHDMGMRAGDSLVRQTILGISAFTRDGRFDQQTFERSVRLQGLTPAGFEERVRQALLSEQLSQAVQGSVFVTEHELNEAVRLNNQTRKVDYVVIPSKNFESDEAITDAEAAAYYDEHQTDFRTPEQVKLEYILLNAQSVGKSAEATDDALLAFFDDNQEKYGRPEERQASHILIKLAEDADQATLTQVLARIGDLKHRLMQGEDFAELAKANSEDTGTAENGGDLGYFGKGIMDPAFEEAVFNLQEGELSEPVRTTFGYHLIKLTGIKAGDVKTFEEARADVEADFRKAEGERLYFEQAEKLADLSYEDPSSLEPASSELNLEIIESDWMDRNSAQGILRSPKVLAAAFSEDVLLERHNSELIELGQLQSIVLRVVDHKEASFEPLEVVKETVLGKIKQQRAAEKAEEEAEKLLARLNEGAALAHLSGDYELQGVDAAKRSEVSMPLPLLRKVFRSPRPEPGKVVSGLAKLNQGNVAVFSIYEVNDGSMEELDEALKEQMKAQVRSGLSRNQFNSLVEDLLGHADINYLLSDPED